MKWIRDGEELRTGGRYSVSVGERHAFLTIKNAQKCDDGPYRLQLDNDLGSDHAVLKLAVNGKLD